MKKYDNEWFEEFRKFSKDEKIHLMLEFFSPEECLRLKPVYEKILRLDDEGRRKYLGAEVDIFAEVESAKKELKILGTMYIPTKEVAVEQMMPIFQEVMCLDEEIREKILGFLCEKKITFTEALPFIKKGISDPNKIIKDYGYCLLRRSGATFEEKIPFLEKALLGNDDKEKMFAFESLKKKGQMQYYEKVFHSIQSTEVREGLIDDVCYCDLDDVSSFYLEILNGSYDNMLKEKVFWQISSMHEKTFEELKDFLKGNLKGEREWVKVFYQCEGEEFKNKYEIVISWRDVVDWVLQKA